MPRWTAKQNYRPMAGRRKEISGSGPTKREALKKLAEKRRAVELSLDAGGGLDATASFREVAQRWYAEREQQADVKQQTLIKYRRQLERHAYPKWGDRALHSIRTNHIRVCCTDR